MTVPPAKETSGEEKLYRYAKAFLVPTLILKASILYFGLNYAMYPDEGYGWGLTAAISLSLFNFALFIFKNWDDEEENS